MGAPWGPMGPHGAHMGHGCGGDPAGQVTLGPRTLGPGLGLYKTIAARSAGIAAEAVKRARMVSCSDVVLLGS